MALTSANKVITSALKTFQPVAIPSATMAITSASHKSGHSICHNKQTYQLSHMWLFHLLHWVKTSAHSNVVIPSTTMAITSANSYCGYNICHNQWKTSFNVVFIFHKQNKVAFTSATMMINTSHGIIIWQITSAKNIHWFQTKSDNNICHIQHPKSWPKHIQK